MLQYLPALGEVTPTNNLGLVQPALGVTSGLCTSFGDVQKLMRGNSENLFGYTWLKEIIFRPAENSVCIFDSGLFSIFGMVKKNKNFDFFTMPKIYSSAYKDYVNFVLKEVPEASRKHCYFINLDTDFLLGLQKTSELNDFLLINCPEKNLIGTYHAADGKKYLDELIEKFYYIALSENRGFEDENDYLKYVQATCCYIKNKKPQAKVHILGRSNTPLFRAVSDLADTCDSSSFRCFGDESILRETNLSYEEFWSAGLNYEFLGGLEKAIVMSLGDQMTEMRYSELIIECLKLYSFLCAANKYSPQVVRSNCPVRDLIDDFFGTPHDWWRTSGGTGARYWLPETKIISGKGKVKKIKTAKFYTEPIEGSIDLGMSTSESVGMRGRDWSRKAKNPWENI